MIQATLFFTLAALFQAAPAPVFQLPSARDLSLVTSESLQDKVVYLEIARTSCPRCAAEATAIGEMRAKFGQRGFEVVTVYDELPGAGGDDPFARALADATKKSYAHPIALNDGGEFHNNFYSQIKGTPSAFLISRSGKVEFLGLDPLASAAKDTTFAKIDKLITEPNSPNITKPAAQRLELFSLLSYSGGVLRSSEFTGRPTLIVTWLPGPVMERLAPSMERLQKTLGEKLRIIAVTFAEFDKAADAAARLCPSVTIAAPDTRAHSVLESTRIPQILLLDRDGIITKKISTLYGPSGIEASVLERHARILVNNSGAPSAAAPSARPSLIRDEDAGLAFQLPEGFQPSAQPGDARLEFTSNQSRVRSRLHEGAFGVDALTRVRESIADSHRDYRVQSEERLRNGALMVCDEWDNDGSRCRAFRVFVNTPRGIVEVQLSSPVGEFDRNCNNFRSTAESVIVERK